MRMRTEVESTLANSIRSEVKWRQIKNVLGGNGALNTSCWPTGIMWVGGPEMGGHIQMHRQEVFLDIKS